MRRSFLAWADQTTKRAQGLFLLPRAGHHKEFDPDRGYVHFAFAFQQPKIEKTHATAEHAGLVRPIRVTYAGDR